MIDFLLRQSFLTPSTPVASVVHSAVIVCVALFFNGSSAWLLIGMHVDNIMMRYFFIVMSFLLKGIVRYFMVDVFLINTMAQSIY
ncbi:hypothetical protein AM343_001588 [Klebsiella variicola]|nr:hypothetical protein AM343_001588 [Klebsiella variicola]